ncbi:MAG TPA: histidine--tRNA ligase [Acidobacteriota bacterium]
MAAPVEPRLFKGTRDFLPEEMLLRERLVETLKSTFRTYGFAPLETPALEYLEILAGKYGAEGDRLIYRLAYKGGAVLALRYDLTVPLARVVAMYPQLGRPFKRYQVQPVWRADTPQPHQGRFREFSQCDVDTIGTDSRLADAEIIALTVESLAAIGFENFKVRINSRLILAGMVERAGLPPAQLPEICRAIDKLDKIGLQGVERELEKLGLEHQRRPILELIELSGAPQEQLAELRRRAGAVPQLLAGADELEQLFEYLDLLGTARDRLTLDLYLARGLDYYTGPIFEAVLPEHPHIGSLSGGGRYDGLIGVFSGAPVPAVGISLGLDRIVTALRQLGPEPTDRSVTRVLVTYFDADCLPDSARALAELRRAGIPAELYLQADKLKKQFAYADRRSIPYVLVLAPDELARGEVALKTLASGEQERLTLPEVIRRIRQAPPPTAGRAKS